jgi:UDP-N-acetylmuramate dehydrogenase
VTETPILDGEALLERLPEVRGRLTPMRPLADLTWFRVGGPAEVLFQPADQGDLSAFLAATPLDIPVMPLGDGGLPGVAIRLGRGFNAMAPIDERRIRVGAAALDAQVARKAAEAGIAGLEFLRGVPGAIGGAIRMNAGCYGSYVADVLESVRAVDRLGRTVDLLATEINFSYRHIDAPDDLIFTEAVFRGSPDSPDAIAARMDELVEKRETAQPIREKTGGSTFRNPAGFSSTGRADDTHDLKAWKVIDKAGCRGLKLGGAQVSEKHCNFLVNTGDATAADLEALGEQVRARVKADSGIDLHWEIKRIGVTLG